VIWIFTDEEWRPVAKRLATHIVNAGHCIEIFDPERSPGLTVELAGHDLAVFDGHRQLADPHAAIVLRIPVPAAAEPGDLDRDALQFVLMQWSILYRGLIHALEYRGVKMLNPTVAAASDEKTFQMLAAAAAGLATLPSLQSARGGEVRRRWPSTDRLAMKPFQPIVRREVSEGRQKMIRTVALPCDELSAGLDGSRVKSPSIVQPFIAAEFEHRVVVVGDKVHGARLPKIGAAAVDIRSVPVSELGATRSELPDDVAAACIRLVRSVGAVIAAIDLLETDDGYIFLDLNCSGHYLFVEQLTGAPICSDIAELAVNASAGIPTG